MADFNETSEQRFERLASLRTNQVLERLRILGNCSNPQVYRYTKEDINNIFSAIEKKIREVRARFNQYKKTQKFKL